MGHSRNLGNAACQGWANYAGGVGCFNWILDNNLRHFVRTDRAVRTPRSRARTSGKRSIDSLSIYRVPSVTRAQPAADLAGSTGELDGVG